MKKEDFELKLTLLGFHVIPGNEIWLPYIHERCEIYPSPNKFNIVFIEDNHKHLIIEDSLENTLEIVIQGLIDYGAIKERATNISTCS